MDILTKEARGLLLQLDPEATEQDLKTLCKFGFGLAVSPIDFINSLKEQINKR